MTWLLSTDCSSGIVPVIAGLPEEVLVSGVVSFLNMIAFFFSYSMHTIFPAAALKLD
jgi:hypothetical protein